MCFFRVSRTAVYGWVQAYRAGGAGAAGSRPGLAQTFAAGRSPGSDGELITERCSDQLKLPFAVWTRQAVRPLLAERFGLRVSVWTAGRHLQHGGLTPQKPVRRACERNHAVLERWLKEEYPAIRAQARQEKAGIHWGDEVGLRSDHQVCARIRDM